MEGTISILELCDMKVKMALATENEQFLQCLGQIAKGFSKCFGRVTKSMDSLFQQLKKAQRSSEE